jgi:hypothetical protein
MNKEDLEYYKEFLNKRNKGSYEIDGAIDLEKWNKSKYKLLFVLKETVGYQNCKPFELKDEIKDLWLKGKNPTYTNIAWLAKSLQIALENNRILSQDEINELDKSPESLFKALEHCAIINIKKHSNPKKESVDKDIISEFHENKELLEWQIKNLSPNVIFAGSSVVWKCLSGNKNGLYKDIITTNLRKHECKSFNGIVFYNAYHPSAWGKYKMDIPKIHKQLFEEIKRLNLCFDK